MDDEDEIGRAIPGERAELAEGFDEETMPEGSGPVQTTEAVLGGITRGVAVAAQVVAGLDAALEGQNRPPVDPAAAASSALGGLGSALGGVSSAIGAADPGVSSALGLAGTLSTTVGSVLGAARSIVESIRSIDERANRHSVAYSFTSAADPDANLMVVSFTMTERLGAPYVLRLTLAIEDLDFRPRTLLGRDCTLSLNRGDSRRNVHGLVRSVERGRTTDRARVITVEIVPALAALELRRDSRTFQGHDVPTILETVLDALSGYGRETDPRLHRAYPTREHCVQYQETDLDFVHRLMEEEGITYFFDHSGEHERMVLVDDAQGYPSLLDEGDHVPFVEQRSETSETEHVHELVRTDQLRATSFALRDLDWTRHAERAVVSSEVLGEDEQGRARELYEHDRAVTLDRWDERTFGRDDADEQLRIRGEEHLTTMDVLAGCGNVTAFAPGRTFSLEDHPIRELDADLLLVSVEHRGHAAQLTDMLGGRAYGDDEVSYECSFVCIPKGVPFRSRRTTPKPRIHGLLSAVVVGADGQEIHSDLHRRVRVQMRWDRRGTLDERSSCFVRVLQPWAGAGFGALFLPRVGMEVAISFLDGDPDRPIVSGCLYNADNPPPYTESADWTKSTLKSKSSPQSSDGAEHFNELRFEDAAGSEQIFVHAEKDLDEQILHDHTTHVGRNQTNQVRADQSETVGGDQNLKVVGQRVALVEMTEDITVRKDRTVTMEKNHTETVQENESLSVAGLRDVYVGKKDTETFDGGREVTIQHFDNLHVEGANKNTTVGGQYNVTVDEHFKVVQGGETILLEDSVYIESSVRAQLKAPDVRLEMEGGVAVLRAQSEIRLEVGASSITLTSNSVVIHAPTVTIDGGDSTARFDASGATISGTSTAQLSADGMVSIRGGVVAIN